MKKEFGKWLMDIGKYVATAVIISSFLGGLQNRWLLFTFSVIIVGLCLYFGLNFVKSKKINKK